MKRYEGMFLFDTSVSHDWAAIEQEVRRLCDRIGAQLIVCVKFDERKLAFEIQRRKRGTYVLTYFDADPSRIGEMDRDAVLSESILRHLIVRPEGLTEERLAQLKAHPAETPLSPAATDTRRDDDRGYGDRDRGYRGRREGRGGDSDFSVPSEEAIPDMEEVGGGRDAG